ncbi:MAG: hypothetical protein KAV82_10385, partial [Phycisphaerae bacterium]|nr:hypothetical protein [Phycisphaerae bacterium]
MATERKAPDVLLVQTNLTGVVGDIDDDPDSPDTNWLEYITNNVDTVCRVSFPTPTGSPTVGVDLQEFKIWVRQQPDGAGADPTVRIELYEDGSSLATILADTPVSSPSGALYSGFWNANLLNTSDGSLVECYIYGTAIGGQPAKRCTVEVGAVEWNVDYSAGVTHEGAGQSDGTSTAAAAGNVEHTGAGQSDGVSTSSADGEVIHTGEGQADGTSTATGSAEVLHTGSGQADGVSTATGSGICVFSGAGQSDGTSTAMGTGTTGTTHEGAGQSDGVA